MTRDELSDEIRAVMFLVSSEASMDGFDERSLRETLEALVEQSVGRSDYPSAVAYLEAGAPLIDGDPALEELRFRVTREIEIEAVDLQIPGPAFCCEVDFGLSLESQGAVVRQPEGSNDDRAVALREAIES